MGCSQCTNAGTAILVDRMTAPLVKENGILLEGGAQFITLHLPDSNLLTIINVYTPRSSKDRAPLWRRVSTTEFAADHLIMGGDFNHLEEVSRKGLAGRNNGNHYKGEKKTKTSKGVGQR